MLELIIAIVVLTILIAASIRANQRLKRIDRLPMQWSFAGDVNWTAPRPIALAFTPALAAIVLGLIVGLIAVSGDPRPGQEGMGPPVVLLVGIMFIGAHAMHLRLIGRAIG